MKYDSMIVKNQKESERKVNVAIRSMEKLLEERQRITVLELVKRTGLSRGFFYKNDTVRKALEDAMRRQGQNYNPKQVIMDRAMEDKIIGLKLELTKAKGRIEKLQEENQHLQASNDRLLEKNGELQEKLEQKEISLLNKI
ncbi:MAG: DUF6262 family protein [Lachnospiraceae bacterium]|nr:DUF6262 family protein [Lachnospiraceae bacterium]